MIHQPCSVHRESCIIWGFKYLIWRYLINLFRGWGFPYIRLTYCLDTVILPPFDCRMNHMKVSPHLYGRISFKATSLIYKKISHGFDPQPGHIFLVQLGILGIVREMYDMQYYIIYQPMFGWWSLVFDVIVGILHQNEWLLRDLHYAEPPDQKHWVYNRRFIKIQHEPYQGPKVSIWTPNMKGRPKYPEVNNFLHAGTDFLMQLRQHVLVWFSPRTDVPALKRCGCDMLWFCWFALFVCLFGWLVGWVVVCLFVFLFVCLFVCFFLVGLYGRCVCWLIGGPFYFFLNFFKRRFVCFGAPGDYQRFSSASDFIEVGVVSWGKHTDGGSSHFVSS